MGSKWDGITLGDPSRNQGAAKHPPAGEGLQPGTHGGCHPPGTLGALCTAGSALPARTETAADSEHPCPGAEEAGRAGTPRQGHRSLRGSFAALSPCRDLTAPIEIPYSQEEGKYARWDWHCLKLLRNTDVHGGKCI